MHSNSNIDEYVVLVLVPQRPFASLYSFGKSLLMPRLVGDQYARTPHRHTNCLLLISYLTLLIIIWATHS